MNETDPERVPAMYLKGIDELYKKYHPEHRVEAMRAIAKHGKKFSWGPKPSDDTQTVKKLNNER
jgi:hypothetical protein